MKVNKSKAVLVRTMKDFFLGGGRGITTATTTLDVGRPTDLAGVYRGSRGMAPSILTSTLGGGEW